MLTRRTQIAAKVESAEGVAETLAAADAFLVYEPVPRPDIGINERRPTRESLDPLQGVPGKLAVEFGFGMDLRGSGAVGTAPDWSVPLRGAGHQASAISSITVGAITGGPYRPNELLTGGTSGATGYAVGRTATGTTTLRYVALSGAFQSGEVITGAKSLATSTTGSTPSSTQGFCYRPLSDDPPSLTMGGYLDGVKTLGIGCRSPFSLAMPVSGIGKLQFGYRGRYGGTTDVALLTGTSMQTVQPPAFKNVTLFVEAHAPKFSNMAFEGGGELVDRDDASTAAGDAGFFSCDIVGRMPAITLDPEMVLVAEHDWLGKVLAGTSGIVHAEFGSGTGKRILFAAPNAQYRGPSFGDRGGRRTVPVQLVCCGADENALDDSYQIAMY